MKQILEYIGKTKTPNLLDDISKLYLELHEKKFPDYHYNTKALSIVSIVKNNEIKKIGMSKVDDLLTDNWGIFMQGLIGCQTVTFKTFLNTNESILFTNGGALQTNSYNVVNSGAGGCGGLIQVGQGTTPASRSDFNIQIPFGTAPESNITSISNSGWNSGLGQLDIPLTIGNAGSFGSISETCLFLRFNGTPSPNPTLLMSRDNISPTVSFLTGETINVDYKLVFS